MKKVLIGLTIALVLVIIGASLYVYVFNKTDSSPTDIKAFPEKYYIKELRSSIFFYPSDDAKIGLVDFDKSYCEFDESFKKFTISFFEGGTRVPFDFVVTKMTKKSGNITADLVSISNHRFAHIDRGGILRFTLTTDRDLIHLNTAVAYDLLVATENEQGGYVQRIERNAPVARFTRVPQSYIGGQP